MSNTSLYRLVSEQVGHTGPIRSICLGPDEGNEILTGGQESLPTAKKWRLTSSSPSSSSSSSSTSIDIIEEGESLYHDHWITAITSLPKGKSNLYSQGCIITGCMDSHIRVYDCDGNLIHKLEGHSKGVISFSWSSSGYLISGSWDGTAKIWNIEDGSCLNTLGPHENGVHVLGLSHNLIATTSTGEAINNRPANFKLRIWNLETGTEVQSSISDHEGPIRSIAAVPILDGYATSSNDGSIVLRAADGHRLDSMFHPFQEDGMAPFILDCAALYLNQGMGLVSCGEDGSVIVWNGSEMLQSIPHPCCVWCVVALPNTDGDFITGGNDGIIRVFSKDPSKVNTMQSIQLNDQFELSVVEAVAKRKSGPSSEEIAKATKWDDRFDVKGKSDAQVMVFNKSGSLIAAQWSAPSQCWIEVGEVTGTGDSGEVLGVHYDHVMPVEIETPGGVASLSLGYNNGESAFDAAQRFIDQNSLNPGYLRQIAEWIQQKAGKQEPTLDMSDPSASISQAKPTYKHIPIKVYNVNDAIPNGLKSQLLTKIGQLNDQLEESDSNKLTANEIANIESLVDILCDTSHYHSANVQGHLLNGIVKMVNWSAANAFPGYDLARLVAVHPAGSKRLSESSGLSTIIIKAKTLLQAGTATPSSTALTSLRFYGNSFKHDELRSKFTTNENILSLIECATFQAVSDNKLVRAAVATLLLNIAFCCHKQLIDNNISIDVATRLLSVSILMLSKEKDNSDVIYKLCLVIGTLALKPGSSANTNIVTFLQSSEFDFKNKILLLKSTWGANTSINEVLDDLNKII